MELLIVVAGIVLLWKFTSSINALATSAKVKAEVMSEEIITEAVKERTELIEAHMKEMEGKTVYSHEEIMKIMRVD
jgi:hypothetical protein